MANSPPGISVQALRKQLLAAGQRALEVQQAAQDKARTLQAAQSPGQPAEAVLAPLSASQGQS